MLTGVPEVDIDGETGISRTILQEAKTFTTKAVIAHRDGTRLTWVSQPMPPAKVLRQRWGALGLPVQDGLEAQATPDAALTLSGCGRAIRNLSGGKDARSLNALRASLFQELTLAESDAVPAERVPGMLQGLQVGDAAYRLLLVEVLSQVEGREGSEALARRALYDTAPDVRRAATRALSSRPSEEYRSVLLEGFRHPWVPVASHAAEALVTVGDVGALPALWALLGEPDPQAPGLFEGDGEPRVREMVRINHLGNCLLCHAPAGAQEPVIYRTDLSKRLNVQDNEPLVAREDLVTGPVPVRGQPLPVAYYQRERSFPLVRADVTYLRQDFSAILLVDKAAPWPAEQRFDFVVRTRTATPEEVDRARAAPSVSPQREAARYVLAALAERERYAAVPPGTPGTRSGRPVVAGSGC